VLLTAEGVDKMFEGGKGLECLANNARISFKKMEEEYVE